ncbi:transmembrane and coiled-coil domain protein 3-like [Dendronephthya gigantea]|uniref:transmembrane and coiled-coil domain protein 3-like n=1 Tax=Dendronephthya gigantea TaxID=151771 RepID=UPI00106B241B|nr:transmembrane and coiled-coil domain protein 3-like [Dendronephthya gigantea]
MSNSRSKKENLDIPQVKVNDKHGSFSSIASSDRSYSPAGSPRHGRKISGFKKMIPWRRKDQDTDPEGDEGRDDDLVRKKKVSVEVVPKKPPYAGRKNRSRSVDHLLTDKSLATNFEVSPHSLHSDIEARLHSPGRSSITDEDISGDSGNENYDVPDGMDNTDRFQKLKRKIEKTKETIRQLQCTMDENITGYLVSFEGNSDPELTKKAFEKRNLKSNAVIGQLQKKLDKYQKALKDLETHEQRAKTHNTAKEVFRGVRTSVKEISGGVRDGVKAGLSGAVSKFYKSNENITDATPTFSKSDSECHELQGEDIESLVGYDVRKVLTPSPKFDEDSVIFGSQTSAPTSTSRYSDGENPLEAKLNELLEAQMALKETVDKAVFDINAIAKSLQEERYKTQDLECQFNTLRSHWNDFSELHQHENMQLRQDIQRNDESIATVDYRLVERVAEIDESFDTFDARISKIENVHQQQQGLNVDDYFEQNIQAKAVLTKFLSVVLAVVTLLFSIFTLIIHGIAPLTRTRLRLLITTIIVVFLAMWWHNPNQYVIRHFQRLIVDPTCEIFNYLTKKITGFRGGDSGSRKHGPDVT